MKHVNIFSDLVIKFINMGYGSNAILRFQGMFFVSVIAATLMKGERFDAYTLNLVLNRVVIPRYGYLAAGFTTLASYICLAVMHGIMYKRTLKDNKITENVYNIPVILLSSAVLIIFGLSMLFFYKTMLLRYAVILLGAALVFVKRRWFVKVYKELRQRR